MHVVTHYNTGLAPVLTLQSHGLIEFLLLCVTVVSVSVIPVLAITHLAHHLHGQPSVGQWRTWWV